MKSWFKPVALLLFLALFAACPGFAQSRSELWQKVEEAKSQGLPQTAIDMEIASAANSRRTILMSKDQDFVVLSARGILRVPLLWVRCGNMATPGLWRIIKPMLPAVERSFALGEKIVEIR